MHPNKKGIIEDTMMFAVSLILLAIFIYLVIQIWGTVLNPDQQIAMMNSDLLRTKINEACAANADPNNPVAYMDHFSLPQPSPLSLSGFINFLPSYAISSGGDPHYVLYYEAFTPGDDIGWEVFQKGIGYRVIAPFRYTGTLNADKTVADPNDFKNQFAAYVQSVQNEADTKYKDSGYPVNVFVNNIVLTKNLNVIPDPGKVTSITEVNPKPNNQIGNLGDWTTPKRFDFFGYVTLNALQKTLIKYRPCGAQTLCLKTRSFVYRYPLDPNVCKDVKNVELVYNAAGNSGEAANKIVHGGLEVMGGKILSYLTSIGGKVLGAEGLQTSISYFFTYSLAHKVSDFSIASPCNINSQISIAKVNCNDKNYPSNFRCLKYITYPMYDYSVDNNDKTTITKIGDHYECAEKITGATNTVDPPDGTCIKIIITTPPQGYCWTPDPYKDQDDWWTPLVPVLKPLSSLISAVFGETPTRDSTNYLENTKSIVLLPPEFLISKSDAWLKAIGWWWGWPG